MSVGNVPDPESASAVARNPLVTRRGFSLIELLVTISIIGLLVTIILPALAASRRAANNAKCLVNLRQIATAMMSYEADYRRLPTHAREIATGGNPAIQLGGGPVFPASVRYGDVADLTPLYRPYMDVEHFVCPRVPRWSINETLTATTGSVNADYYFTPGYYGNGADTSMTSYWTRSDRPWTYNGRRMTVLVGDKSYYNVDYHIFNHIDGLSGPYEWRPGAFGGFAYRLDTNDESRRYLAPTNHAFADGSARAFVGPDRLTPVNGLYTARPTATYLMPFDE